MKPFVRVRSTVSVALVGLLLVALAPGSAEGQAATARQSAAPAAQQTAQPAAQKATAQKATARKSRRLLRVSPTRYVGGQQVTFGGNIGKRGVRRLQLQINMNRPGDGWATLATGLRARTRPNGTFRFRHPAPSMFGILVRVASGRLATPAVRFNAKSQDLLLTLGGEVAPGQVRSGDYFSIRVDTTPTTLRRPDLPGPAFLGRTLTLQRRIDSNPLEPRTSSQWETLKTTKTDSAGNGKFTVTAGEPGNVVYRVRQEAVTSGVNAIGWYPSFPLEVDVVSARQSARAARAAAPAERNRAVDASFWRTAARAGAAPSAGTTHKWGSSLWDFAWEFGESLSTRPYRGTDRTGAWRDASNGSGRVAKHNGGLALDSQRYGSGPGDHGTTAATLAGQPMKYGRWETKLRMKSAENNAQDYRVRAELVPDDPADYKCGAQNITIAEVTAHGSRVVVGARAVAGSRRWTYAKGLTTIRSGGAVAFAVEVAKGHISWFVNGRVIATVRDAAAVSDVPMTMRLSLVGNGQEEMNRTMAISDWQRGWTLDRGKQDIRGHALTRGTHSIVCP